MTSEELITYYRGRYDQCHRLLTSPRMNRPQREVIEDEAYSVKEKLERHGVTFKEDQKEVSNGTTR